MQKLRILCLSLIMVAAGSSDLITNVINVYYVHIDMYLYVSTYIYIWNFQNYIVIVHP